MKKLLLLIIAIFSVIFIVGCNGGGGGENILFAIFGQLFCPLLEGVPILGDICSSIIDVIFQVDEGTIEIHQKNGQWLTLTTKAMDFSLLKNPSGQQVMTYNKIPVGEYDKIKIDLKGVKIVTKDKVYDALIPNKELIINTTIVVNQNGKSSVELNLDLAGSLHPTEEGKIVFAPVMNIKSRKNIDADILDQNKKLIKVKSGTLLDDKKVGMDLDGKIKNDFVLDRNIRLSLENNKIVAKELTLSKSQPTVTSSIKKASNTVPNSSNKVTGAATIVKPKVTKEDAKVESNISQDYVIPEVPAKSIGPSGSTNATVIPIPTKISQTIIAKKWLFNPNTITVKKGQSVNTIIEFTPNKVGSYKFLCSSCKEWLKDVMKGMITVNEEKDMIEQKKPNCIDSDGGYNLYIKGYATGFNSYNNEVLTWGDHCSPANEDNTGGTGASAQLGEYLYETVCENNEVEYVNDIKCPNGCQNGACMGTPTIPEKTSSSGDLKDYPSQFVKDGVFNGYLVVGENAKPIDSLSLSDIMAGMKYMKCESGGTCTWTPVSFLSDAIKLDSEITDFKAQNAVREWGQSSDVSSRIQWRRHQSRWQVRSQQVERTFGQRSQH
ncbi:hypothetical protein HZC30_02585 [Candidatus Woesearchaeota archaeon]|nr:hypothetical protein [Candidatus Woesearchaeota archaeon]